MPLACSSASLCAGNGEEKSPGLAASSTQEVRGFGARSRPDLPSGLGADGERAELLGAHGAGAVRGVAGPAALFFCSFLDLELKGKPKISLGSKRGALSCFTGRSKRLGAGRDPRAQRIPRPFHLPFLCQKSEGMASGSRVPRKKGAVLGWMLVFPCCDPRDGGSEPCAEAHGQELPLPAQLGPARR